MKEVLKTYHRGSAFKGTQLIKNNEEKKVKHEMPAQNTFCSENVQTTENNERGSIEIVPNKGMLKIHPNESIFNKNQNYTQKVFEVPKEGGEYQHTTFETLKTEYFLHNGNNLFEEHAQLPEKTGPLPESEIIEKEIETIFQQITRNPPVKPIPVSKIKKSEEPLILLEDDDIPHTIHSSVLMASKSIWDKSWEYSQCLSPRTVNKKEDRIFYDIKNPLIRKILICHYQDSEQKVELVHAIASCGYLSSPQLNYGTQTTAEIDIKDKSLPLNAILSPEILTSLTHTFVSIISCGFEHCTVLTKSGTVATWGYGGSGCLGQGNYISYTCPKLIKSLPPDIVHIDSGAYHTAAVSATGDLYIWGRSDVNQLGISRTKLDSDSKGYVSLKPSLINKMQGDVRRIALGEAHTLVLDKDGILYAAGWGQHGQLGLGAKVIDAEEFEIIKALTTTTVCAIGAGSLFSAAIDNLGKVFTWGNGEQGQLGFTGSIKSEKSTFSPVWVQKISNEIALELCCGECSIMVYCKSGNVYGWGQGVHAKSLKENSTISTVTKNFPQKVIKINPTQYWGVKIQKELSFIVIYFFVDYK